MPLQIPKSLFRYRKISSNVATEADELLGRELSAIEQSFLWFSEFSALNDKMEGTFETGIDALPETLKALARPLFETVKTQSICSLSSSFDNKMMWGLYAHESQGICIEYDPRPIMDWMVEETPLLKVKYDANPPQIFNGLQDLLSLNENRISTMSVAEKMLATKSLEWNNEGEYRLIRPTNGRFFHHQKATISVTIGSNQKDPAIRDKIQKCAESLSIPLYEAVIEGYSISRKELFSPSTTSRVATPKSIDDARKLLTVNEMSLDYIPAVADAIVSAETDPHCKSLTDYNVYASGEYMWFNYECSLPDADNIAEVNRRKQMKFKLANNKATRDWSVRISERHYK